MNVITHALLPVLVSVPFSLERGGGWSRGRRIGLAVVGALPDVLTPHLSLAARYSSWSHGVPALLVLAVVLSIVVGSGWRSLGWRYGLWLYFGYALHLFCDLISGGIAWGHPIWEGIIAVRWVPYRYWIPLDLACVLAVYFIFRAIPRYRAARLG